MNYSKEFVEKVKKEFPDNEEMHQALDRNCISVGAMLRESSRLGLPAEFVIKAFQDGQAEIVKKQAESRFRRENLYCEWLDHFKKRWGVSFFDAGFKE